MINSKIIANVTRNIIPSESIPTISVIIVYEINKKSPIFVQMYTRTSLLCVQNLLSAINYNVDIDKFLDNDTKLLIYIIILYIKHSIDMYFNLQMHFIKQ